MRDFHLRFAINSFAELREHGWYDNENFTPFDLLEDDPAEIPDEPGAYVLGTADGTVLTYPWGVSRVLHRQGGEPATACRAALRTHDWLQG